jgi:ABC-type glycerol-3-phosphate transport system substrate-binding protein
MPQSDGEADVGRRGVLRAVGATGAMAGGLSGCLASGQKSPNTVEIAGNTDVKNNIGKIQQKLHEVGLSKEIELDAIAGAATTGARKTQYNRWLSANLESPTLFLMDSAWTMPFIIRDQLANVTERRPELAKTVTDEYLGPFVESVQGAQGDVYGVPLFPTTGLMYYRRDLVEQAGYAPRDEGWATNPLSWQKFSQIAKETQRQTDTRHGFTFQANAYEGLSCCDYKEFTGTWGGSYFGARKNLFGPVNGRPVTVDSEPVLKATKMVRSFIHGTDAPNTLDSVAGNISPRAVLQWTENPSRKPFANGNAVMHRNWPYAIPLDGAEDAFGEDLGAMPIPYGVKEEEAQFDGYGGSMSALGGWHICLNPNSPKTEPALEVMQAMTDEKFQLFLFEELGWLPPRPSLLDSERAQNIPIVNRYLDTLKYTLENSVPRPVTVAWPQESTKISQQATAAFSGDTPPDRAMSILKGQLKEIEAASDRPESAGQEGGD